MIPIRTTTMIKHHYQNNEYEYTRYKGYENKIFIAGSINNEGWAVCGRDLEKDDIIAFAPDEFIRLTFVDIWEMKRNGTLIFHTDSSSGS